jgi:hypothetical protein
MPIKFQCPHCQRWLTVTDQLAGKKGKCKTCNQVVTVPAASATAPAAKKPAGANGTAAPSPPPPVDAEAEAAALLSERPPEEEAAAPQTVDFACPNCDAQLHLAAELAGRNAPCPECKRIFKVPQLAKRDPTQWRQADVRKPSLAKPTGEAPPEGAWSTAAPSVVSGKALTEAGVIPKKKKPRTRTQKLLLPVLAATLLLGGGGGTWWYLHSRTQQRLKISLDGVKKYAESDAARQQVGPVGQALLWTALGEHTLRTGDPSCGPQARDAFGKAFAALKAAPAGTERDAALTDLALLEVGLGGGGDDVRQKEIHISWEEAQKLLRATLEAVGAPEGRLLALRAVARRLLDVGQADRVLPLTGQLYPSPEVDKAEAHAAVGLEFLAAGDQARAEKAAELALAPYRGKTPPPVRAGVVALALALKKNDPKPAKGFLEEENNHFIGEAEGLARLGQWDEARKKAASDKQGAVTQFRALLAVAEAAADAKVAEAAADVEAALAFLDAKVASRNELTWALRRLAELGQRVSLSEDRRKALADAIPDKALRARAQLALFQGRLAANKQPAEDAVLDPVEGPSGGRLLADLALARHNTRVDPAWANGTDAMEEPRRALASVGAALGLQDRR